MYEYKYRVYHYETSHRTTANKCEAIRCVLNLILRWFAFFEHFHKKIRKKLTSYFDVTKDFDYGKR